jgi:hypothetical protein
VRPRVGRPRTRLAYLTADDADHDEPVETVVYCRSAPGEFGRRVPRTGGGELGRQA